MARIICITILLLTISYTAKSNYAEKDTLNVLALSGLNIRLETNSTSEVIGKADYGESIVIENVFEFSIKDTIDARTGHWVQINYNGIQGCVFDGYLSKLPVPKLTQDDDSAYPRLNNYINSNFQPICKPIVILEPWFDGDGKDGTSNTFSDFGSNVKLIESGGYEVFEYRVSFEEIRFSEVVSLFEIFASKDPEYMSAFKIAKQNYEPSLDLMRKTKKNSTIRILKFTLTDGVASKEIKFSSET